MFEFDEVTYEDTVPFIPPITHGKVVKVQDGDTITIATILPYDDSPLYRFSVRINGITCPSIKTKNKNEKSCALMAKNLILEKAMDNIVSLENMTSDKHGKLIADVICDGESLGEILLNERLAVPYDGKERKMPHNWLKYYSYKENIEQEKKPNFFNNKIYFFSICFTKKNKYKKNI